jgi:hypothetical protein
MRLPSLEKLPTIIDELGHYVTRDGQQVYIREIRDGWAFGAFLNGIPESWDISGRFMPHNQLTQDDIVAKSNGEQIDAMLWQARRF